ncbi:MAG: hypothetical protein WC467_02200 [Patescibacteria group bacterium]
MVDISKENILAVFSENENKIALLYLAYADKFPAQAKLWDGLAKDEKRHAALLADLDRHYGHDYDEWQISDNAPFILAYVGQFVDDCLDEASKIDITFKEALNNSLSLEQSMIEKNNFNIFSTKIKAINEVLHKLNRETDGHRLRLLKFIEDRA